MYISNGLNLGDIEFQLKKMARAQDFEKKACHLLRKLVREGLLEREPSSRYLGEPHQSFVFAGIEVDPGERFHPRIDLWGKDHTFEIHMYNGFQTKYIRRG